MRLFWPDIIFTLRRKQRTFQQPLLITLIITIWGKKGNLPRNINYKPPNVPWAFQSGSVLIVSHDLSIKRLDQYFLNGFLQLFRGDFKLLYFILKVTGEKVWIVLLQSRRVIGERRSSSCGFTLKKVTQNHLQLALFVLETMTLMYEQQNGPHLIC